jgi:protein-arginine deiminase
LGDPNDPGKPTVAYVPGVVNLQVWGNDLLVPKPFGPQDVIGADWFETKADEALKIGARQTHYLDDWDVYHRREGEVHCGTNVLRDAPTTPED